MPTNLSKLIVVIKGLPRFLFSWPIVILGLNSAGDPVPLKVADDGSLAATIDESTLATKAKQDSIIALLTGSQRAIVPLLIDDDATIAAGKKYISLSFSSDFVGTVNGMAINGADFDSFDVPPSGSQNDTFGAIVITVAAGTISALYY